MTETIMRESLFLGILRGVWHRFLAASNGSVILNTVRHSTIVSWMIRRLNMVFAAATGLIFAVPHSKYNNLYSLALMLMLAGLYFLRMLDREESEIPFHNMSGYAAVFAVCVAVSFIISPSQQQSLRFLLFYITAFLGLLLMRCVISSRRELNMFVCTLLAPITLSGLYGLYQSYIGIEVKLSQIDLALNTNMPGRIYSFYDNPNNFAEILVLTLPLYAALFFMIKSKKGKYIVVLAAVPPAISLVLTLSRSGWVAFAFAMAVFFYFTYRWVVPIMFAVAAAAFPLLPEFIRQRAYSMFAGTDTSIAYRATIRGHMAPLLERYWGSGMGLGTDVVKQTIIDYHTENRTGVLWWYIAPHAHNIYLQLWAEMGIVGAASFCGACITFLRKGAAALYSTKNFLAAAGLAGIAGALMMGFGEYIWFYPRVMLMFWLITGVTLTALRLGKETL